MKTANIQLETLTCPSCTQKIEATLNSIEGVDKESIKVLFNASKVKLSFDDSIVAINEIERAIRKVGFTVEKSKVR